VLDKSCLSRAASYIIHDLVESYFISMRFDSC